jgi:hypothetical protein
MTSHQMARDSASPTADEAIRAFSEKFNIPMALAWRLLDLHRVALERETRKARKSSPQRSSRSAQR